MIMMIMMMIKKGFESLRLPEVGLSSYEDANGDTFPLLPSFQEGSPLPPLNLWINPDDLISFEGQDTSKITIHTCT